MEQVCILHKFQTHRKREGGGGLIKVPQLLKMLTIAWASAWWGAHQQLQVPVRTIEEHFLLQQHGMGTQQHSGAPEKKTECHMVHKWEASNSLIDPRWNPFMNPPLIKSWLRILFTIVSEFEKLNISNVQNVFTIILVSKRSSRRSRCWDSKSAIQVQNTPTRYHVQNIFLILEKSINKLYWMTGERRGVWTMDSFLYT